MKVWRALISLALCWLCELVSSQSSSQRWK